MQRLFRLRTQRRYDEAVSLLQAASHDPGLSAVQQERLSFELGNLFLQWKGEKEACAHWREHAKRFPDSPRREEVRVFIAGCGTSR